MNIGLENVSRGMPPPIAAGSADVSPAPRPAGGWKSQELGAAELAKVAGEEDVDEKELRRDDPLGNLVSRAFNPEAAQQVLQALLIG